MSKKTSYFLDLFFPESVYYRLSSKSQRNVCQHTGVLFGWHLEKTEGHAVHQPEEWGSQPQNSRAPAEDVGVDTKKPFSGAESQSRSLNPASFLWRLEILLTLGIMKINAGEQGWVKIVDTVVKAYTSIVSFFPPNRFTFITETIVWYQTVQKYKGNQFITGVMFSTTLKYVSVSAIV